MFTFSLCNFISGFEQLFLFQSLTFINVNWHLLPVTREHNRIYYSNLSSWNIYGWLYSWSMHSILKTLGFQPHIPLPRQLLQDLQLRGILSKPTQRGSNLNKSILRGNHVYHSVVSKADMWIYYSSTYLFISPILNP